MVKKQKNGSPFQPHQNRFYIEEFFNHDSNEFKSHYKSPKGNFVAHYNPELMKYFSDVKSASSKKSHIIIDARSEARFKSLEPEPRLGLRSGTIPNSLNLPFEDLLEDYQLISKDLIEAKFNSILFVKDDYNYYLTSDDCLFEVDNDGIIIVRLNDKSSIIKLSYYNHHKKQDSFEAFSYETNATLVTENDYMPEFSIASFDDSSFLISRPIRQGVPIISTVPTFLNNSSTTADIFYFNSGKGNYYKTIYFRIICNKIITLLQDITVRLSETLLLNTKISYF